MNGDIQAEYERLKAESYRRDASEHFLSYSLLFADQQIWKSYQWLLDMVPKALDGCDVVDIGCKYGHATPLFFAQGARSAIGIDVEDTYLGPASDIISGIWPQAQFKKSEQGYLPIQSDSVDLVLVNEVISHVNPGYLPGLFSEIARILRVGGYVIISDGNNIANAACRQDLVEVYDAWENGPDGRKTGRDVVEDSFLDLRRRRIRAWYPDLPADRVEYAALNTSGLFGDYFRKTVDRYVTGQDFVARPYRPGNCPTNPSDEGVVMEFGFYPQQVEMALAMYGIQAHQVDADVAPHIDWTTPKRALHGMYALGRYHLRKLLHPNAYRGASWGFQIVGVKER
jgi:SAM-dependent methyltransferase